MPEFLTIAQAAERTGRSISTIRRLVRSIVREPGHADRGRVLPSPEEVSELEEQGAQFAWSIDAGLVDERFPTEEKPALPVEPASSDSTLIDVLQRTITSLEQQLDRKDGQLEAMTTTVRELNERIREGNVLVAGLQERLALPEPKRSLASTTSRRFWPFQSR